MRSYYYPSRTQTPCKGQCARGSGTICVLRLTITNVARCIGVQYSTTVQSGKVTSDAECKVPFSTADPVSLPVAGSTLSQAWKERASYSKSSPRAEDK